MLLSYIPKIKIHMLGTQGFKSIGIKNIIFLFISAKATLYFVVMVFWGQDQPSENVIFKDWSTDSDWKLDQVG